MGVVGGRGRRMVNVHLRVVGLELMDHEPKTQTTSPPGPPHIIHTYTHIHTYIHTYIHTHTRELLRAHHNMSVDVRYGHIRIMSGVPEVTLQKNGGTGK